MDHQTGGLLREEEPGGVGELRDVTGLGAAVGGNDTRLVTTRSLSMTGEMLNATFPPDLAAPSFNMRDFIWIYTPVVIGFGAVGNVLCILVLRRSKLKLHPIIQVIFAVCITDTLFLLCLLVLWMRSLGMEIYKTTMGCQFISLLQQMANFLSTWLVVVMAVERYITVCECSWLRCLRHPRDQLGRPRRDRARCTIVKIRMAIIALLILSVVVYVNLTITIDVSEFHGSLVCAPLPEFVPVLRVLTPMDIAFNVLLPYFLIALLTVLTCKRSVKFYFSRKRVITRRGLTGCRRQFGGILCPKKELRLTKMSGILCMVYFLLTGPIQTMRIIQVTRQLFQPYTHFSLTEYFWQQVCHCAYLLSFSTHFWVLVLSHGGYRQALRGIATDSWAHLTARVPCVKKKSNVRLGAVSFPVEVSSPLTARVDETSLVPTV